MSHVCITSLLPLAQQVLPWLEQSVLEEREKERKERLYRQNQQQAYSEGKGFGPVPKDLKPAQPYVYVSAYNRFSSMCCASVFTPPLPGIVCISCVTVY